LPRSYRDLRSAHVAAAFVVPAGRVGCGGRADVEVGADRCVADVDVLSCLDELGSGVFELGEVGGDLGVSEDVPGAVRVGDAKPERVLQLRLEVAGASRVTVQR
jgi:hypothetical protein